MNTKISFSIKTFICIYAFILTFTFSFANSNNEKNIDPIFNTHTLKISTVPNNYNDVLALTLSYDVATFCAGATGISKPKVSETGGVFILTRKSPGTGSLAFNNTSGEIDYSISNPGVYTMTYKKGDASVSTTITVNKCN